VKNVGDAATKRAMTNFVGPDSVTLKQVVGSARSPVPTVVGGEAIIFVSDTFELPPGTWKMQRFELAVGDRAQNFRLVFELADHGLNASGLRWFPSRLVGGDDADLTSYGDSWPRRAQGFGASGNACVPCRRIGCGAFVANGPMPATSR
jgi:hypothetical protein